MTDIDDKLKALNTNLYDMRTTQLKDKHNYATREQLEQHAKQTSNRLELYTLINCMLLLSTIIIII